MRTRIKFLGQQSCKEKIIVQAEEQSRAAQMNFLDCATDVQALIRRIRRKARIKLLTSHR
ncbi:hypothetical protein DEV92_1182 [Phyllobacterium myrsinacearum]|uniref:Uncharacterized protein n=1 Tax=Phyllobacterium myrsinacearum TaxID=28101 RepID=A0A2S9JDD6_9HYPH|nr:hypothetical protein C5750_18815 [Phyllobacterium myrsinacearum]PWV86055.1 hypothetical protein DEV92_1182 [Phyllobacterium myrsinacearum]RZS88845.1 hypothetical protein EV217_1234 [Phyllobacterium myrsinacearum]RZU97693.1 hypothetical protein EV654_4555 [Phyllobacterium myrsinacearum]